MDTQERDLTILKECLEKKERILNNLFEMTTQQEEYLAGDEFDMDVFSQMLDVKDAMIDELNTVDDGFESTYERVGGYLKSGASESDVRDVQNRVREITRLSIALQALEERNRASLEKVFAGKNKEVYAYRKGSDMVNSYYQTMSAFGAETESTLDRKK